MPACRRPALHCFDETQMLRPERQHRIDLFHEKAGSQSFHGHGSFFSRVLYLQLVLVRLV